MLMMNELIHINFLRFRIICDTNNNDIVIALNAFGIHTIAWNPIREL
jgi:hypothetical protein